MKDAKLAAVRALAARLGINALIERSTRKNKKFVATIPGSPPVHFGHTAYQDFLDHKDPERRKRYLVRAKGIRDGKGRLTWNNPKSANYWSVHLLW